MKGCLLQMRDLLENGLVIEKQTYLKAEVFDKLTLRIFCCFVSPLCSTGMVVIFFNLASMSFR